MALRMTITEDRDVVIVALAARIDSFAVEELSEGFEQVRNTGKWNIALMMRDLDYVNSRGIAALISFLKWADEEGRSVKLAEVPEKLMQLLRLVGIEKFVSIYDTLPEAIESFEHDPAEESPEEEGMVNGEGPARREFAPRHNLRTPLALAGAVILLLVLVVLFFSWRGEEKGPEMDLQPLVKKIGLLEERLAKLESRAKKTPDIREKIDGLSRNLNERLSHLEKDINRIKEGAAPDRKGAEVSQPAVPSPAGPPRLPAKPAATRFHTVSAGENLYRIALRYGMSVQDLRRLNNLRPDQSVQVGQKLNVGTAN